MHVVSKRARFLPKHGVYIIAGPSLDGTEPRVVCGGRRVLSVPAMRVYDLPRYDFDLPGVAFLRRVRVVGRSFRMRVRDHSLARGPARRAACRTFRGFTKCTFPSTVFSCGISMLHECSNAPPNRASRKEGKEPPPPASPLDRAGSRGMCVGASSLGIAVGGLSATLSASATSSIDKYIHLRGAVLISTRTRSAVIAVQLRRRELVVRPRNRTSRWFSQRACASFPLCARFL